MDQNQIQQVRRFNRLVTQRVGALEDGYLKRGRPLGEARLLFEAGHDGMDVRALRARLGLDPGYLSRLLRSLEAQKLIKVQAQATDRRVRRVVLTAKGRAERAAYDELSNKLAQSILRPLDAKQRHRLVAAMIEVRQLIDTPAIELCVERPGSPDARYCLEQYFRELSTRFDNGFDPAKSNSASHQEMTPPAGYFVLARLEGRPAGCGALKIGDGVTGEIKRMWTAPSARGLGVARAVIQRLEAVARRRGLQIIRLETNRALTEAQALYRKAGYREVPPFNNEPFAHHWFEKRL
jgi:DNA-binding MarR family transcriptional regulator/GNAT superfamily N-acetyltransferase